MTELPNGKVDLLPLASLVPKHPKCTVKHSPQHKINEELGLHFPLEDLLSAEVPKQGWIHGNPVVDGWAGAVMRKPFEIQKYYKWTDRWTDLPTW